MYNWETLLSRFRKEHLAGPLIITRDTQFPGICSVSVNQLHLLLESQGPPNPKESPLYLLFFFGGGGRGGARAYSWLYSQELILVVLRGPYRMPGFKPRSAACKTSALPTSTIFLAQKAPIPFCEVSLQLSHYYRFRKARTLLYLIVQALPRHKKYHHFQGEKIEKKSYLIKALTSFWPLERGLTLTVLESHFWNEKILHLEFASGNTITKIVF